ncbi:MAG: glycosyltransferase family 2 protein [Sulfobacillus sp.]
MAHVISMLPVRNEAARWLRATLEQLSILTDRIVVFDDASADDTADFCKSYPKVRYYRGDIPWFEQNEAELRRHLWELATYENPEWILALDADELFEERATLELPWLLNQEDYDAVAFRIFDFWKGTEQVRTDGAWNPWNRFSPLLVRYDSTLSPDWMAQPIHCGRFPLSYRDRVTFYSHLRVQHFGWARGDEHLKKYLFYRERDLAVYGSVQSHTESVLSSSITLEPWVPMPSPGWFSEKEHR